MRILVTSIVDVEMSANNRIHEFLRHLSRKNEVTIISNNDPRRSFNGAAGNNRDLNASLLDHIEIWKIGRSSTIPAAQELYSPLFCLKLGREFRARKFDVHLNYNTILSGYTVALLMKKLKVPTVYDLADDLPEIMRQSHQMPWFSRSLVSLLGFAMVRRNISLACKVTYTTPSLKIKFGVPNGKAAYIPNGVDTELFKAQRNGFVEALKHQLGIDGCFVLGYVGVHREWVSFDPVLEAMRVLQKSCPDLRLLVIGSEGRLDVLRSAAREMDVFDKIVFAGTVPYQEVPGYISCMDACLIPFKVDAISENASPLKLFEYMACEKPIVSTRVKGVKNAVEGRVLYASDREEYMEKILQLYNDKELRKKLGREGRAFIKENYEWPKMVSKLEKILDDLSF
jgi:glycosyltransferase involved in cell wall biosynthesis